MAHIKTDDLHNFRFKSIGAGIYKVTYIPDNSNKYWYEYICENMTIIDATKNAETAKSEDIEWLRHLCLKNGEKCNGFL